MYKMIKTRSGRRTLSENDTNNISEEKKSEIMYKFKSEIWSKKQQELLETQFKCPICLELVVKGQLISERNFGVLKSPKK